MKILSIIILLLSLFSCQGKQILTVKVTYKDNTKETLKAFTYYEHIHMSNGCVYIHPAVDIDPWDAIACEVKKYKVLKRKNL